MNLRKNGAVMIGIAEIDKECLGQFQAVITACEYKYSSAGKRSNEFTIKMVTTVWKIMLYKNGRRKKK